MELIKFVRTTSDVTLKSLELRLLDVIEHIAFLSDYWLLTESEISNNSVAFQWYHRLPQIFEDNRMIVENKTQEYQDALKGSLDDIPISFSTIILINLINWTILLI